MTNQLQMFITTATRTNYPTGLNGRYKLKLNEIHHKSNGTDNMFEIVSDTLIVQNTNNNIGNRGIIYMTTQLAAETTSCTTLVNLERVFYVYINNYIDLAVRQPVTLAAPNFSAIMLNFTIEKIPDF